MPIRVQVVGHGVVEFPDGTSQEDMQKALAHLSGPVSAEDFAPAPKQPEGSALSRFAAGAGEMLNPVAMVEGVANAVRHPADTAKAVYEASADQFAKAKAEYEQGHYTEAVGHLGGMIPLIGPAAAAAGEQIASGDVAGGVGKGVGLLAPSALAAGASAVRTAPAAAAGTLRASMADALAAKAAGNVVDVMTPKVGANKMRFGGMADRVAPDLVANGDTAAWSRQGLHGNVSAKLEQATQALDASNDARLSARTFDTQPIIDALLEKRKALTAEAVDASKPTPVTTTRTSPIVDAQGQPISVTTEKAAPIGQDVVPGPNKPRVAQIDQAIAELQKMGPVARYDDLRTIRQAYDGPAKAVYNPSMTQDFLSAQGGKLGAADVTGALRDHLAKMDPQTAAANAQYSLYKTAQDVLDATEEVQRSRPQVGRRIAARIAGTVIGGEAGGAVGAGAGLVAGPLIDAVASSGWTTQLKTAQLMSKLATAIRGGDEGTVLSVSLQLKKMLPQAAVLTGLTTSPSGSQTQPAGAR